MIIGISSPYKKSGLLYTKFRKFFGQNDDDVLVIRAPTRLLNPTIPQKVVDEALAEDYAAARAPLESTSRMKPATSASTRSCS